MTTPDAASFEIDGRCPCIQCVRRTTESYWMVGECRNCSTSSPLLIQFRRGDTARPVTCPACGCARTVHPTRLAKSDDGAVSASLTNARDDPAASPGARPPAA